MLQVRNGEVEMLGVLFDRYQTPLYNFYAKMTQDRGVSEDLVQEVFLRILRYRQTYRPGTAFRTWMYQIARNAHVEIDGNLAEPAILGAVFQRFAQMRREGPQIKIPVPRQPRQRLRVARAIALKRLQHRVVCLARE